MGENRQPTSDKPASVHPEGKEASMIGDEGEAIFWNVVAITVIIVLGALLFESIRAWRSKP
jgi:hypothetical protein